MNDGWGGKDTEDLVADRLKFIGALLEDDAETTAADAPATGAAGLPPEPGGQPLPTAARRRRRALAAVLGLAAAVGGVVVLAAVWAPWSPGEEAAEKPDQSGIVACAKLIVEGTVAGTDSAGPGKVGVRLDVERYVKPGKGPGEVRFVVPREDGAAYRTGSRVLVSVSRFDDEVPLLFTGSEIASAEEWMTAEANRTDGPACPGRG
ncbi:hypothetical protein ACFVYF_26135 [Streptomyces sp. NPDC058274]|uniref:hypothetical protein n=1 Tax=Streptomyces sp. NPDC058274 TaxID=3346416 RepID=UPI0036EDD064